MPARPGRRAHLPTTAIGLTGLAVIAVLVGACIGALSTPVPGVTAIPSGGPVAAASPAVSEAISAPSPRPTATPSFVPSAAPAQPSGARPTTLPAIPVGAVPILYYHRAEAPPAAYPTWSKTRQAAFIEYDVLPVALAAQLDWLVANHYSTILPRDLVSHWDLGTPLPAKPVILTFDDGFHDWVTTILPMLQARGMVAEFYITLGAVTNGNITWAEVRTLASAGQGIGAHDVHHVQLAELGQGHPDASPATMWAEVNGAREAIASHVGVAPDSMAYVGGGFSPALEAMVKQAGYTSARTIRRGIVQAADRPFELHVVRIGPYDDVTDLMSGTLQPGLPVFVARMHGVSDRPGS